MAFDAQAAKQAGYSDGEIADYLGQQSKFDVAGARKAGYSDGEIIQQLSAPKAAPKPMSFMDQAADVGKGVTKGAMELIGGVADQASQHLLSPLRTIQDAANLTSNAVNLFHGKPTVTPPGAPHALTFQDQAAAVAPKPQTMPGRMAERVTPFAAGAFLPGSAVSRAANVFAPAVGSELAGGAADRLGAPEGVVRAARFAGALGGGAVASARFTPKEQPTPDEAAANLFAQRGKVDPEAMAAKAADMRAAGVEPTLTDVSGTQGQRLVKAVGITNENAGETLQNNANQVTADTKPAVMARTRGLSGEARTADQLASDLKTARSTEAAATYAEPYAAKVELSDKNVIQALRDPEGAGAINRAITAARSRMDYGAQADLEALKATAAGPTGDGQVWPTTGRALDRVQLAFGNKAEALDNNGAHDIASGLKMRQDRINGLLDTVDGLQPARAAYRAKSMALDILDGKGLKDPFSTDPTDYAAWVDSLPPEAQHANQVAIRQNILDTLGGQRASPMGSIDQLAQSQYARQNLSAALGEKMAGDYLANLTARLAQKRNATQVSPYAGSPTKMLQNDTAGLDRALDIADTAVKVKTGNVFGLATKLATHLKTMGISDAQAEALAKAAVDPSRTDSVIAAITRAKGPRAAQSFVTFRGGLLGAARGTVPAARETRQPAPR